MSIRTTTLLASPLHLEQSTKLPSREEWESLQPMIADLYIKQQHTARQVVDILKEINFKATEKMLRDRFRVWGIDNKNNRVKRERQNYESRPASQVVRFRRARRRVGVGQQVTDSNIEQLTLEEQHSSADQRLLSTSRSSTPNYVEPETTVSMHRQSLAAFMGRHGNAELAVAFGGPCEPASPPRILEEDKYVTRTMKAAVNFYTRFREHHKVVIFRGVESSPVIDLANDFTFALHAVNKYSIKSGWSLLDEACAKATSRLHIEHPDSLVYLLKFLMYVQTTADNGAKERVSKFLADIAACRLGEEHPIALICSASHHGLISTDLCEKLFHIFQDRPISHPENEAARDKRKIRTLYSHILMYQSRFKQADAVLAELEAAQSNPCDKVGLLRQLAESKRRQHDYESAEQALQTAWQILQVHQMEVTSRGASIQDTFASVYEDSGNLGACEDALFAALRCQKYLSKSDKMRRVARPDCIFRKQGKSSESLDLSQAYPDVFQ